MMKMKSDSKNFRKVVLTCALCGALVGGGVLAYLTATDSKINQVQLADSADFSSKIKIVESNWSEIDTNTNGVPDAVENLTPNQEFSKNPAANNKSSLPAYVMMTVSVPTADAKTGTESTASRKELFTYAKNAGWTEKGSGTYDPSSKTTKHVYIYDTSLAAGTTSSTLFDTVKVIDLQNGQIASGDLQKTITVKLDAIQTTGFVNADAAYNVLKNLNS